MNKILITTRGGCIKNVYADESVEIELHDFDDADDDDDYPPLPNTKKLIQVY